MSTPHAIHHGSPSQRERTETDRANQRVTLALFAGLIVLATVGVTISVIVNSMMTHGHSLSAMSSASTLVAARAPERIGLYVAPSWKPGPDGERHDAFSKTNFTVKVGQPLQLRIDNRDEAIHSITSSEAGVNIAVKRGVHTYTILVNHAGRFKWICVYVCDPFSMGHIGYMQGYITAT